MWGLQPENCRVLTQPAREQALEEVQSARAEAEDTLLVYYAGHGVVHELSNELYLALPGTDPARLYTALRYQDVRDILLGAGIRARRKVVVLDCCWSGSRCTGRWPVAVSAGYRTSRAPSYSGRRPRPARRWPRPEPGTRRSPAN
ncbi:caspase family protein [Streptomyces sp. NPDC096205]|uniref:caspase family protein n=1 Tax=Streptomyces sp. NPDC096205 TaxID=3366081 RepID=UPI0038154534